MYKHIYVHTHTHAHTKIYIHTLSPDTRAGFRATKIWYQKFRCILTHTIHFHFFTFYFFLMDSYRSVDSTSPPKTPLVSKKRKLRRPKVFDKIKPRRISPFDVSPFSFPLSPETMDAFVIPSPEPGPEETDTHFQDFLNELLTRDEVCYRSGIIPISPTPSFNAFWNGLLTAAAATQETIPNKELDELDILQSTKEEKTKEGEAQVVTTAEEEEEEEIQLIEEDEIQILEDEEIRIIEEDEIQILEEAQAT